MKFKSLTVKGAIPFPEELHINFPEARKVALVGNNGQGKSTVLDCIFAALYGDVTKPNGIYSLFKGRKDGLIDLTFEVGKHTYRIKRLIDGDGRKQKPYIFRDGEPLNEGKKADFNAQVIDAVGISDRMFLAAVYNAQTQKGNPLALNDRDRRDLLSETLGLEQFTEPFEKVCEALRDLDTCCDRLIFEKKSLLDKTPPLEKLEEELASYREEVDLLQQGVEGNEKVLGELMENLAKAKANAQNLDEVKRQIGILLKQIGEDEAASKKLEERIKKNQSELLDKKEVILDAVATTEKCEFEIRELERRHSDLSVVAAGLEQEHKKSLAADKTVLDGKKLALKNAQDEYWVAHSKKGQRETQIRTLKATILEQQKQASTLGEVPCAGMDIHAACPLLATAKSAAVSMAENEQALQFIESEPEIETVDLQPLEEEIKKLDTDWHRKQLQDPAKIQKDEMDAIAGNIAVRKRQIEALAALVQNAPFLKDAEERMEVYRGESKQIQIRLDSNREALEQWRLKEKEASALEETVRVFDDRILWTKKVIDDARLKISELQIQIGRYEGMVEQSRANQLEIERIANSLASLQERRSLLQFLKEGLGPKGAKALLIDAAGPEITELVNALLRECYGSKFTIGIQTLRELSSKADEYREALNFVIIDNETGEETPVENKSGGEQQLIREVISLGLCIYQRRKAGVDTRTIIRDESCSALSEENTVLYVKMLDKAAQIGDFDQVLYVSHKGCAQQMADAVIQIEGGKAQVIVG